MLYPLSKHTHSSSVEAWEELSFSCLLKVKMSCLQHYKNKCLDLASEDLSPPAILLLSRVGKYFNCS